MDDGDEAVGQRAHQQAAGQPAQHAAWAPRGGCHSAQKPRTISRLASAAAHHAGRMPRRSSRSAWRPMAGSTRASKARVASSTAPSPASGAPATLA
ncbi:hypothetical protein GY15_01815 [Delftia sp. 670]|nr:hypothetical protein GY15_01815 [Delftia sp. 670]